MKASKRAAKKIAKELDNLSWNSTGFKKYVMDIIKQKAETVIRQELFEAYKLGVNEGNSLASDEEIMSWFQKEVEKEE